MICILLPVKNGGENIKHALRTLTATTDYPHKIIIVDGGSTDGTEKIIDIWAEQYEPIEAHHIKSKGLIDTINYGLKKALEYDCEGVYLTQDDVIHYRLYQRDWLQILSEIGKQEDCGQVISIRAGGISGDNYVEGLHWAGTWSTYIPKRVLEKLKYYEEI